MKLDTKLFIILITLVTVSSCYTELGNSPSTNSSQPVPATPSSVTGMPVPKAEAEKLVTRLATQDGCKDSTADMRLSFINADGKPQQIDFRLQRKYEGSKVTTLLTVTAPKEESEKALLIVEEPDKPTDATSYLAGLKKITHLSSDRSLNFRGSKSTVQEMLGMELGKYEVQQTRLLNPESGDGELMVELKEKPGLKLSYPRIEVVFGGAENLPKSFKLYDARGGLVKTIVVAEVKTVQNYQTVTRLEIEDHQQSQQLKLETRNIKYDTGLPAVLFTEDNLIKVVTAASKKIIE